MKDKPPSWNAYLIRTYGITEAQYEAMATEQGGKCWLCQKRSRRVRLSVDHDHETKTVRALLCGRCNRALGYFEYSTGLLERLSDYIGKIIKDRQERKS